MLIKLTDEYVARYNRNGVRFNWMIHCPYVEARRSIRGGMYGKIKYLALRDSELANLGQVYISESFITGGTFTIVEEDDDAS